MDPYKLEGRDDTGIVFAELKFLATYTRVVVVSRGEDVQVAVCAVARYNFKGCK